MKFSKIFTLILCFGILCTACDSDDDNNAVPLDKLIGTWESIDIEFFNCIDPQDDLSIPDGMCGVIPCLTLGVNADGTYSISVNFDQPPEFESGTVTATATTVTICEDGIDCQTLTYSITGNQLTIGGDDDECDLEIVFQKQ